MGNAKGSIVASLRYALTKFGLSDHVPAELGDALRGKTVEAPDLLLGACRGKGVRNAHTEDSYGLRESFLVEHLHDRAVTTFSLVSIKTRIRISKQVNSYQKGNLLLRRRWVTDREIIIAECLDTALNN